MILDKFGLKNSRELEHELGCIFLFFREYTINDFFSIQATLNEHKTLVPH